MTVVRYWQNQLTGSIQSEVVCELINGPYDDLWVFDHYAVTIKNQNEVEVIYYEEFRGGQVPVYAE